MTEKIRCYVCCPPWGGWWDADERSRCRFCGGTGWIHRPKAVR